MQVFYAPGISGKQVTLDKTESMHCIQVLRHSNADLIHLMDGEGGIFKAVITDADSRACKVEVVEKLEGYNPESCRIHIAIAPPKQADRFEWMIEKLVEIGIAEITPVLCKRSERKEVKPERLEKIIISSMKQAIVTVKPKLNAMTPLEKFITSTQHLNQHRFIAHCLPLVTQPLFTSIVKGIDVMVLIGPEGDFTPDEIQLAMNSGWKPVSLGKRRLRTETAALLSCAGFNVVNCS
jgi:16S rRNA (uracil1498-N3)-methyltransferase